jgi:uncharacterized protein YgbK (DUF1537 family)
MIKLLVIADDLTGAIETGTQFAKKGIRTYVSPEPVINDNTVPGDIEVLVLNTESRHISPNEAAEKVKQALKIGRKYKVPFIYKKVDSTLRGNIGVELESVLSGSDIKQLPFIPAHPDVERYTKEGSHYVGKKLLQHTSYADDPLEPVESSFIPDIIKKQCDIPVQVVPFNTIRGNKNIELPEGHIVVFDCLEHDDLRLIIKVLKDSDSLSAISGSAALAELLPEILGFEIRNNPIQIIKEPALVINGSLNPVSFEQVKYAEDKGFHSITIPSAMLSMKEIKEDLEIEKFVQEILEDQQKGKSVILKSISSLKDIPVNLPRIIYNSIAERMGIVISNILEQTEYETCVIYGGDTLMGIMKAMKIKDIYPHDEILDGSALSRVIAGNKSLIFISKPGGFGKKEDLVQILKKIEQGEL